MSGSGFPDRVRWIVRRMLPDARAEDVLGDLEERHHARVKRIGEGAARRRLWIEMVSLLIWRARSEGRRTRGEEGRWVAMDLVQDVCFGFRALRRRPGFTATAVLVLALGIGAPTTVLWLVNRIFFVRPAQVVEPHRLVRLYRSWGPGPEDGGGAIGNPEYRHYREQVRPRVDLAAYGGSTHVAYSLDATETDQLLATFVSDNYFDVIGATPSLGRSFVPDEDRTPGVAPVTVVSHGFWVGALGADPDVVGSTLTLNGVPFTVVGVAPERFEGLGPAEVAPDAWLPVAMYGTLARRGDMAWWERQPTSRSSWLSVIGRLAPGVTLEAVRAELVAVDKRMRFEGRGPSEGLWVRRQFLYSPRQARLLRRLSTLLLTVVSIVLAISAANAAVLLLAWGSARHREIGVRTALGASRGRIARQLLTETMLLGGVGGAMGLALAYAASGMAASLIPLTLRTTFRADLAVGLSVLALTLGTSLAVGLAPVFQATHSSARDGARGAVDGSRGKRLRSALVVAQLGLSLILVSGALLFSKSFKAARSQNLGFGVEGRAVVQVNLRAAGYDPDRARSFVSDGLVSLRSIPGVTAVTTTRMLPFRGEWSTSLEAPPGATSNFEDNEIKTGLNAVSAGYFALMDMPLIRGRALSGEDGPEGARVVVVNEALAELMWPGEDPLGKPIPLFDDEEATVVGVAATATYYELGEAPFPQAWLSAQQTYPSPVNFILRTELAPTEVLPVAQRTLRDLDPTLAFAEVTTLSAVVEEQTARYEVTAVLVGVFSTLALVLASCGLFGVMSHLVSQRTREIGVRMALGAGRGRVAWDMARSGVRMAVVGLVLGVAGALALRRFTESLLYGVEYGDPVPLVGAALVLALVAVLATIAPARRAAGVDPMVAIRVE